MGAAHSMLTNSRSAIDAVRLYEGDIHGNPPAGKYQINTLIMPDFRKKDNPKVSLEEMRRSILSQKDIPLAAVTAMNHDQWNSDFSDYMYWKMELQNYLKYKFSDMWYRGDEK